MLVQMAERGFLVFQQSRVFQGKMGVQVMPAYKDFLVCQALMAKKESVGARGVRGHEGPLGPAGARGGKGDPGLPGLPGPAGVQLVLMVQREIRELQVMKELQELLENWENKEKQERKDPQAHQEKQETKDQRAAEDSREKREKRGKSPTDTHIKQVCMRVMQDLSQETQVCPAPPAPLDLKESAERTVSPDTAGPEDCPV
ncbi:hypothetical protein F7725_006104 [Dissostichus mawsoni]|uniref:Uncharacterized protein n=1 Tax=Dissostichus mawsoni TaxID=36200 RepID=A0A7J5YVI2_DISMA|nr:hypothetical protein F7725_006104 [Dissostichus mawsoni]